MGIRRPFFSLKCSNDAVGGVPWQMDRPAAAQTWRRLKVYQNTRLSSSKTYGYPRRKGKGRATYTSRYQ